MATAKSPSTQPRTQTPGSAQNKSTANQKKREGGLADHSGGNNGKQAGTRKGHQ
jgi:hypothetical protein